MGAHVDERAAAGAVDLPEPVGVGAGVGLDLADEVRLPELAAADEGGGAFVHGGEEEVFGAGEEDAGAIAGVDHVARGGQTVGQRFLAEDVLPGGCGGDGDGCVEVVGGGDSDGVDRRLGQQAAPVVEGMGDAPAAGELSGGARRGDGGELDGGDAGRCEGVDPGDEAGADQAEAEGQGGIVGGPGAGCRGRDQPPRRTARARSRSVKPGRTCPAPAARSSASV